MGNGEGLKPAGVSGFWGNVTSTIDWCEENHVVSHHIAEYWNTLSSLPFVMYTLLGLWCCKTSGAGPRFWLALVSLGTVGVDATGIMFTYLYLKYPILFQISYTALVGVLILMPMALVVQIKRHCPNSLTSGLWSLYLFSVSTYLLGTGLWIYENSICDHLRGWREEIGYPLRIFSELHAWWHLLTGIGSYTLNIFCLKCRAAVEKREDLGVRWLAFVPVIVKTGSGSLENVRGGKGAVDMRATVDKRAIMKEE
ncbi:Alkaline ceramidase 3 [Dinochytrium kinnereticum]|nr:Alkaline ceramidase 3 [Dinochytrium kinnereticum]